MYNSASPVLDANGHNAHASLAESRRETEQLRMEVSLSLRCKGLFLYTVVVMFHLEWFIRLTAMLFLHHTLSYHQYSI